MIKILLCSKALSAEHRPKFCSLSVEKLERDVKQEINKQPTPQRMTDVQVTWTPT
jgi:hypothetical protein